MITKYTITSLSSLLQKLSIYKELLNLDISSIGNVLVIKDENNKTMLCAETLDYNQKCYFPRVIYCSNVVGGVSKLYNCSNKATTTTTNNLNFEVDRLVCTDYGFILMSSRNNIPMFFLSKTNRNEIAIIGTPVKTNTITEATFTISTYDMVESSKEYNITKWYCDNTNNTSLVNVPIPESTNNEYFPHIYFCSNREYIKSCILEVDNRLFYTNGYIALEGKKE